VKEAYPKHRDRYGLHILLFLLTLGSTMFAGGRLVERIGLFENWQPDQSIWLLLREPVFLMDGLLFGGCLLLFLTFHEFGHYFAARFHKIKTSLPYYIPTFILGFGTLGAVIRIREPIPSTRKLFDVGVAGPLAGFVVALLMLIYAFATLPDPTYINDLGGHEALKEYVEEFGTYPSSSTELDPPEIPGYTFVIGQTPLYWMLSQAFDHVPPMDEMYHFPILFASWMGLFFTALNLLPVGQLDGGHILYALVGPKWHVRLARGFVIILLLSGSIGFVNDVFPSLEAQSVILGRSKWFILSAILYFYLARIFKGNYKLIGASLFGIIMVAMFSQFDQFGLSDLGYWGWFVWCLLIIMLIKIEHPPVLKPEPLDAGRKALAILSIIIFILCFSIAPLRLV